jgi:hypothetical protein
VRVVCEGALFPTTVWLLALFVQQIYYLIFPPQQKDLFNLVNYVALSCLYSVYYLYYTDRICNTVLYEILHAIRNVWLSICCSLFAFMLSLTC